MAEPQEIADGAAAVAPILEIRGVAKRFDATQALDDVSLTLHAGEIHALLGENGAGKSTLIKIITGVHQPDRGQILLAGRPATIRSAAEAQRLGVAAIYQEPLLFPDLNVAENIFISHQDRGAVVDWRLMFREAEAILAELGVSLDVRNPARGLTLAAQQSVEIAKAISLNVRILIMDEPTASLSAHEVQQLFRLVRDMKRQGVAILFVSHRIEEVFEIADKVTVFRDGRRISTRPRHEATPQRAIADMVGREIDLTKARATSARKDRVLSVADLGRRGVFEGVTFDLRRGEVLGFAGLIGAGRTELCRAIFGLDSMDRGSVHIGGKAVHIRSPREAVKAGVALIPEDRQRAGLSIRLPIGHNMTLANLEGVSRFGFLKLAEERKIAADYTRWLQIRCDSAKQLAGRLSGGNQQKVVIAKWLVRGARVFLFDEPTRGIDVGAKAEVFEVMDSLARSGAAILLVSSELLELLQVADRILVMRQGQISGELPGKTTQQDIMRLAALDHTTTEERPE